jgi:hypothetical protein
MRIGDGRPIPARLKIEIEGEWKRLKVVVEQVQDYAGFSLETRCSMQACRWHQVLIVCVVAARVARAADVLGGAMVNSRHQNSEEIAMKSSPSISASGSA